MKFDIKGLLEPQVPHFHNMMDAQARLGKSWDGSHMGTGKTYVARAIAKALKKKFVVLCPRAALPVWNRVLSEQGLKPEVMINYEKLVRGKTKWLKYATTKAEKDSIKKQLDWPADDDLPFFLRSKLKFPKDWFIFCDESHRGKGVESLTAGIFVNLKRQGYQCHLMSATQAMTPLDMRAFGFLMDLHKLTMRDFKRFCEEAGAEYTGRFGAMFFDSDNKESEAKLKKIHEYLFHIYKVGSRLTREDMGDIFPENHIITEAIDMGTASDKIQDVYDEMEYELQKLEDRSAKYRDHIFAILTAARMKTEILKVPSMVDIACEMHNEGKSVVISVNYTNTIEALLKRLGEIYDPNLIAKIYGRQTARQRNEEIDAFQRDEKRFTVANMLAGGECVSLHDLIGNFPRSSIWNPSYRSIAVLQFLGRIDRAHTKTPVTQVGMFAARTIEEEVCRNFQRKKDHLDILNDGDLVPKRIFNLTHGVARGMNV